MINDYYNTPYEEFKIVEDDNKIVFKKLCIFCGCLMAESSEYDDWQKCEYIFCKCEKSIEYLDLKSNIKISKNHLWEDEQRLKHFLKNNKYFIEGEIK